jgi:20S proteasome subunit beta 2
VAGEGKTVRHCNRQPTILTHIMPGLSFENHQRNEYLVQNGVVAPQTTSTGTTIVGCKFNGGVVIAADTRATSGPIVADKNCEKLHRIAPKIWCAGAGTAADTEMVTQLISSNIELHSLSTGREPRVITTLAHLKQHLFKYQGHIGAYLIVAGVDPTGPQLFSVQAHGSSDIGYYLSLGSGSLAAMAVLESKWKKELTREEAMALCAEAIEAGIWNDLGSGSNVDLCVMEMGKPSQLYRNYITPNVRAQKQKSYKFARGTTAVLGERISSLVDVIELDTSEEMEVDA